MTKGLHNSGKKNNADLKFFHIVAEQKTSGQRYRFVEWILLFFDGIFHCH